MYVELRLLVELSCKTSGPWALGQGRFCASVCFFSDQESVKFMKFFLC